MRIVHVFAWAAAIVALSCCPSCEGKSVAVVASSTGDGQTVTVNGRRVEPGEFETEDGVHVSYSNGRGSGKRCKRNSVRVSSVSSGDADSKATVSVQEDSHCSDDHGDEEDDDDFDLDSIRSRFNRRRERILRDERSVFGDSGASGGSSGGASIRRSASASASSGMPRRDVLDRRFFDVEDLVRVIGSQDDDDEEEDEDDEEMLPRRRGPRIGSHDERRDSSSGSGEPGERRKAEVDGDGAHARASTSGNGPHHESASVRRTKHGTHAHASASSSSH